jgi:dolichol-phosphate mannosyltransferase
MYTPARCLIIIPTYNEIENVSDIIAAVLSENPVFEVLIVDDNSPDGTADTVKQLRLDNPKIHLLQRKGKLGLGTAYIEGFKYGLANGFTHMFEMDADFSHNPQDLNHLLAPCLDGTADFTIGSRYIKDGGIKDWPMDRLVLSSMASLYVRIVTFMPIKDPTAGFKCYKAEVLASLDLSKIKSTGYAFQIEMKYAAYIKGYRWKEVPIIFKDRVKGSSKMNLGIVKEAIFGVLKMRLNNFKGYYS